MSRSATSCACPSPACVRERLGVAGVVRGDPAVARVRAGKTLLDQDLLSHASTIQECVGRLDLTVQGYPDHPALPSGNGLLVSPPTAHPAVAGQGLHQLRERLATPQHLRRRFVAVVRVGPTPWRCSPAGHQPNRTPGIGTRRGVGAQDWLSPVSTPSTSARSPCVCRTPPHGCRTTMSCLCPCRVIFAEVPSSSLLRAGVRGGFGFVRIEPIALP